jgi:aminopeptidase N
MMKIFCLLFCVVLFQYSPGFANDTLLHHEIIASISVESKTIDVVDSIKVPGAMLEKGKELVFYLNGNLSVRSMNKSIKIIEIKQERDGSVKKYQVIYNRKTKKELIIPIRYNGIISGEIKEDPADIARGFSETNGIISEQGVFLSGSTMWVPYFEDHMFSFNLTTYIDAGWAVISQGECVKNISEKKESISKYNSPFPSDEVYLVAAKWTEYHKQSGNVLVQAVFRTPDEAMALKYLDVTIAYLSLYEKLIGPYPYTKFTLVENFWETGYGMPSFTLLGEKIIRFPFILHSSYPHELLHNYWGNSVYVDASEGNWCEGLTS